MTGGAGVTTVLHHTCPGPLEPCGFNQYARCRVCGSWYRVRVIGEYVVLDQVAGAAKLEGER